MAEENEKKKSKIEGWRKFVIALSGIGAGCVLVVKGYITAGTSAILAALALFNAANTAEHRMNNKKKEEK